ncbi:MAG: hypothetical protein IJ387_12465, partial [Thermoguttaceae bacterium]|nr:hypothetical protein [Thermoguttaceae bacterium]
MVRDVRDVREILGVFGGLTVVEAPRFNDLTRLNFISASTLRAERSAFRRNNDNAQFIFNADVSD